MNSVLSPFLRRISLVLALAGVSPLVAAANGLGAIELRETGDVLRLQLDAGVGVLGSVTLSSGQHPALRIGLKQVSPEALQALITAMGQRPEVVRSIEVVPGFEGYTVLELGFHRPMRVLDETVAASPGERSRWELVLAEGEPSAVEVASVMPALEAIGFTAQDDRLVLNLSGSAALVAEVSLASGAPAVVVDLPGVPRAQLDRTIEQIDALPAGVRAIKAQEGPGKAVRLVIEMHHPVDLVDTGGYASGAQGVVSMSLVPDLQPVAAADGRRQTTLRAIEVTRGDGGGVDLVLSGATGARLNVFPLLGPSRFVVDFLGWRPDQVAAAIEAFRSAHPMVRQAVLTETRLGSARVVFDMAAPVAVAFRGDLQGTYGRDAREGRLVIGLGAPAPGAVGLGGSLAGPLDLRLPRDLQDLRKPQVVIRPVQLEGTYADGRVPDAQAGTRFSLLGLLERALDSDPKYGAAKAELRANIEVRPQARAAYLPVAAFDYQRSNIGQKVKESVFPTGSVDYPSTTWNLTITQPLIRMQALARIDQAEVSAEQAQLNLLAAEQDLILRVAGAYLGLLAARDAVDLAKAERETTESQLELARTRLQSGLGTVVHVHETEARYAMAQARELEALNREEDARDALKEIVGEDVSGVHGFRADFTAAAPRPGKAEAWVMAASEQNLALQARRLGLEVAALEIRRQRAGHLPTLDAFGTVSRQDTGGSLYGGGQDVENRELGVRLRVPIFEGGLTSSLVREAVARRDKAEQELEQELRKTERAARSAFLGVQTSVASLEALRQNVIAQESALAAKLQGFRSGLQTIVMVVDAYRLYYAARREYLQARYEYLVNRLKLKQSVGTLGRSDLEDLATLLAR